MLRQIDHDVPGVDRWLARDARLNEEVVADLLTSVAPSAVRRLAAAASQVRDARLSRILATGSHIDGERLLYLVSERTRGVRLDEVMATRVVEPDAAAAIVGEVARALEVGAAAQLHHGYVRPSAITITPQGRVVLSGLAVDGELATQAGVGRGRTEKSDVRALMRIYIQAVTGKDPDAVLAKSLPSSLPTPAAALARSFLGGRVPSRLAQVSTAMGPATPAALTDFAARSRTFPLTPARVEQLEREREERRRRDAPPVAPEAIVEAQAKADAVVALSHSSPEVSEVVETGEIPVVTGLGGAGNAAGSQPTVPPSTAAPSTAADDPLDVLEQITEVQNPERDRAVWEIITSELARRWPDVDRLQTMAVRAQAQAARPGPLRAGPLIVALGTIGVVVAAYIAVTLAQEPIAPDRPPTTPHEYPAFPLSPSPTPDDDA